MVLVVSPAPGFRWWQTFSSECLQKWQIVQCVFSTFCHSTSTGPQSLFYREENSGQPCHIHLEWVLSVVWSVLNCGTAERGSGFKQKEGRFKLGIRKKFFSRRVVRHWNRESKNASSLEMFKARWVGALSNII